MASVAQILQVLHIVVIILHRTCRVFVMHCTVAYLNAASLALTVRFGSHHVPDGLGCENHIGGTLAADIQRLSDFRIGESAQPKPDCFFSIRWHDSIISQPVALVNRNVLTM